MKDEEMNHGSEFKGRILKGTIIDEGTPGDSNDHPVANPVEKAPYCVINNLPSDEVVEGDTIWFEVDDGTSGLMFGRVVEEYDDPESEMILVEAADSTGRRKLKKFIRGRSDLAVISEGDLDV